jgi:hypothetical protein
MAEKPTWTHLVRFKHKGVPVFAQLVHPKEDGDLDEQFEVSVATGDPVFNNIVLTGDIVTVGRNTLLAPFATVPIVINTGLNYKDHVTESLFYSTPVSSKYFPTSDNKGRDITPLVPGTLTESDRALLLPSHTYSTDQTIPSRRRIQLFSEPIRCNKNVLTTKVSSSSKRVLDLSRTFLSKRQRETSLDSRPAAISLHARARF